jgi:hypothetical protein
MAVDEVLWKRDAHTKAKHELLLAFFNKWVSIHSSYFASQLGGGLVRIYDGFAGPGVYLADVARGGTPPWAGPGTADLVASLHEDECE